MPSSLSHPPTLLLLLLLLLFGITTTTTTTTHAFDIKYSTIDQIQQAFQNNHLTSRQLVQYYLDRIQALNPLLRAVIEINPDALDQADNADSERQTAQQRQLGGLHGIPILLKDSIGTKDRLNTTAGSLALLGSVVPRDAGVVEKLRQSGAVILGKASLTEWANFRSRGAPNGWCARSGQGRNPYVLTADTCSSSSGSAIAAAADLATVTLGTETDGSIICPSAMNSVVGIKPTVGLTSRSGVILISSRQDTIGPICRTVSDAVHVLDAIVGYDPRDAEATRDASGYVPVGGYRQFLRVSGLEGKRLGILRKGFFDAYPEGSIQALTFKQHFITLREKGAILVDDLEIANASTIVDFMNNGEFLVLPAEFKQSLNEYLSELIYSPVRSLTDIIDFNNKHKREERMEEIGQSILLLAESTKGIGPVEERAIDRMNQLSMQGLEKLMKENKLDGIVTPGAKIVSVLGIGGYPGISVPAGYASDGVPFGICFAGLKGSEPTLIELAYAFEQATNVRVPPSFKPSFMSVLADSL
ncbi:amidase protein [Dioscorea alata]|uniref:Amidase protein n=1 Tax=Dioscorea alata TaxID=55571 RepID=A0ACB7V6H1_DIOAL|nr:amidase protein [Dioscorea alata]